MSNLMSSNSPWFVLRESEKFPNSPLFRLSFPKPAVVIRDPVLARRILTDPNSDKASERKSKISGTVHILFSYTRSPYWKMIRKAVVPAFSPRQVHRMSTLCRQHVETWIQNTIEPLVQNGGTFDPALEMTRLTTAVICEAAFEYHATLQQVDQFLHHTEICLREFVQKQLYNKIRASVIGKWLIPSVRQAHASAQWIRTFCITMLDSYRQRHPNNQYTGDEKTQSVLRLLAENPNLTDMQRVGEMSIFLIGGYDTTGYTLSNALTLLAEHTDVAEKLHADLKQTEQVKPTGSSGEDGDCRTSVDPNSWACWSKCEYLQHVIRETFRLYPTAAFGGSARVLNYDMTIPIDNAEEPKQLCKNSIGQTAAATTNTTKPPSLVIPKGCMCFTPHIVLHRNKTLFPNPNAYNPDRWMNATPEMNQGLLTFSAGPRTCVAQALATAEIRSVLPRLLRHYKFTIEQKGELDFFMTLKFTGCRLSVQHWAD